MSEFVGQETFERNMTITLKDEGSLSVSDLSTFLFLFESLFLAALKADWVNESNNIQNGQSSIAHAKDAYVDPDDTTVICAPTYGGHKLSPFACKSGDEVHFYALFKELESSLQKPLPPSLVNSLSNNENEMWTEIALSIRKSNGIVPSFSKLEIEEMTYCSPPKITYKGLLIPLVATVCLCGGKIDLFNGKAELNGIVSSIIQLQDALLGEKALEESVKACVDKRSEEKDSHTRLENQLRGIKKLRQDIDSNH